ncbi:hypothetical protein O0I10_006322 [Lichtheimia ornata]|uniref:Uncharacterized protein n=1 Tax=Lichtheimia ornata TaxID=688661 RepID=A0AAD7V3T1_9FUNG|nr:uncharacterized protein O0I10_006322 [Lichtheimia ornata]KAJ8658051.1 hypothetical protein O0I10_006322 [Lichtheimia ornata]
MTLSIGFDVIDNLRASASQGQHAHVIQQTFAIVNELQNLQLHLLDLRARSYVACAQFTNALETATTMQEIDPASAIGYLCQGYIHMEQGRYIAASHVYDKALERVDKHDPLYETVQAANTEVIQQGEKRRDFICDLPMEISAFIIQQVFTCDPFDQQRQYVTVSWAWWHRIMASNHLEYTMQAPVPLDETNDMVIQSFNYTCSLTLKACKSPFGAVFQQHRFTCLTTLAVYASRMGAFAETILALQLIGSQLRDLTFVYKADRVIRLQQDYRTRLQYVMEKCPNLISLHCEATIDISGIDHVYPKLRELKLYGVRGTVDGEDMMMIREHMPGLKILDMAITGSTRPLFVKDTWLLRHLSYGDRPTTNPFGNIKQYGEQGLVSF